MPDVWCQGLITPIYKSGDKSDPTNYRGICVSSCLGKLFCPILNRRLCLYFEENKILHNSQIGFLPENRTADHVFTLRTLIDKYVHYLKEKVWACFGVDFRKAFDSVWHEVLFYKLLKKNVGGHLNVQPHEKPLLQPDLFHQNRWKQNSVFFIYTPEVYAKAVF